MVQIKQKETAPKVLSPSKLAHVVLRTNNFQIMVDYYKTFLGGKASYENQMLSFITYDDEHHRVAIGTVPGTRAKDAQTCGLEHIAFSFETLEDLLTAYQQRKAKGILPFWSVNHGPTTSIYYKDPDGNQIETQVDNFDTNEAATEFMMSHQFAENPFGTDFDPEDWIQKLEGGAEEKELKCRIEIGPRGVPEVLLA